MKMKINKTRDEKYYPLTRKEFEEKVIELTLSLYDEKDHDYIKKEIDRVIETEPLFWNSLYGYACFVYENPALYGKNCKRVFEDGYILQNAVGQLRLMIG